MAADCPLRGPLRLYVLPIELLPDEKPGFLVDALQTDPRDTAALANRTFGELRRRCGEVLRSVPVDDAVLAVLPGRWNDIIRTPACEAQAREAIAAAAAEGLATLVLHNDDSAHSLHLPEAHTVVLRWSLLANRRRPNEYVLPAGWFRTPPGSLRGRLFTPQPWRERPVVGFRGAVAAQSPEEVVRGRLDAVRALRWNVGWMWRRRALDILAHAPGLTLNVETFDDYFAGAPVDQRDRVYDEYVAHLLASDYVLCVRGRGNFSHRLYETLAVGRIPVILDTNLVLPLADEIDWRTLGVWVPLRELDSIGERIRAFHAGVRGDEAFAAAQERCWRTYHEMLAPFPFTQRLPRVLAPWLRVPEGSAPTHTTSPSA
jgi:hypothetical protein